MAKADQLARLLPFLLLGDFALPLPEFLLSRLSGRDVERQQRS